MKRLNSSRESFPESFPRFGNIYSKFFDSDLEHVKYCYVTFTLVVISETENSFLNNKANKQTSENIWLMTQTKTQVNKDTWDTSSGELCHNTQIQCMSYNWLYKIKFLCETCLA